MTEHDDPLRRALAQGDPACPDGQALSVLGSAVRRAMTPPRRVDLLAGVLERIRSAESMTSAESAPGTERHADSRDERDDDSLDAAVDAHYDLGQPADPRIARVAGLVRGAAEPERDADLVSGVRRRLAGSARHRRVESGDGTSRRKMWSAVLFAHLAALILVSVYNSPTFGDGDAPGETAVGETGGMAHGDATLAHDQGHPAPVAGETALPASWEQIGSTGGDLLQPRRSSVAREAARRDYGMDGSAEVVAKALAWLQAQQDREHGNFAQPCGDARFDLAAHSLALLALLGEGLGDSPADVGRIDAIRRGLGWLHGHADEGGGFASQEQRTAGLAVLALVEGAALLDDEATRADAEAALTTLDAGTAGAAGLGGFTLLAFETAQLSGMTVPKRALEQARRLGRSLPSGSDPGHIGFTLFARLISGRAGSLGTLQQLERLDEFRPIVDQDGQVNPLQWYFATLAMREAGGENWKSWARQLEFSLVGSFTADAEGRAWVPASRVRYAAAPADAAAGNVFATSLVLLNLQAPYRYVPLAK